MAAASPGPDHTFVTTITFSAKLHVSSFPLLGFAILPVHTLELRPSSVYRKLGAGREGRIECEEEDGLRDFL